MKKQHNPSFADTICDVRIRKVASEFFDQINILIVWGCVSKIIDRHDRRGRSTVGSYWCSQGVELPFRGLSKNHGTYIRRSYTSRKADCAGCPLQSQCLSGKQGYKKLSHSSG